jgi:hypothetical protein
VSRGKERAKERQKEDNEEKKKFIRNNPCQKRCRIRKKSKNQCITPEQEKKTDRKQSKSRIQKYLIE